MPEGLPATEALWCLLRLLGHEGDLAAFREAHGARVGEDALVASLERLGIQARVARIQDGDLPFLALPTLIQGRDGTWMVLRSRIRGGYLLLGPAGPLRVAAGGLALSGRALDLSPGLPRGRTLRARLLGLAGHHRPVLIQIAAATLALQCLGLVMPALTAVIMDRALPDGARSLLALAAAGIVLTAGFSAWVGHVRGRALLYVSQRMDLSAQRGFLEHILALPYPLLRGRAVGEWLQGFDGLLAGRELAAEKTLATFLDGAMGLVLLGVMTCMLPGPALAILVLSLVLAAATLLVGRAEAGLQAREVEAGVREQGFLAELLGGIATLKAAGGEAGALRRWRGYFRKGLGLSLRRGRLTLWATTGMDVASGGLDAALLIWGGLQVVRGALGLGTFLAFLQLASAFMEAVQGLVGTGLALLVLGPQLGRASEILDLTPPPQPVPRPRIPGAGPVVMKDVWFRYQAEGPWILAGQELEVEAGGNLRLTGPSGWGKSTILRLLAGLETPEKGHILIHGRTPGQARQDLLYLPQFVELQGASILENLTLLSGGASREALLEASARTGLDGWVGALPMGFKTILPHGARTLSGGQRQWVALTAAMASGRGVLLLDEPCANLDPLVAARLSRALEAGPWTLVSAGHG